MSRQTSHTLILTFAAFIWGMAFVAQSMGAGMGAFTFLACRSWLAVLVLLPTLLIADKRSGNTSVPRTAADGKHALLGGIACGTALFFASFAQQYALTINPSTAKASFLTAMYVVFVPIAGLFLGRKCGAQVGVAVVLTVAGLYLLCMQNGFGGIEFSDVVLIICSLLFTLQILLVDRFSPAMSGILLSLLQFFVTAVWSSIAMFIFEQPAWADVAANLLPIAYCGIFSSGVAYTLQIIGQKDLHPAIASIAMCTESVWGAVGGWLILHQTLSAREIAGCVLIFAAVLLAQLPLDVLRRKRS